MYGRGISWSIPVVGFLLPLVLVWPLWIYCRAVTSIRPPRTNLDLLWFAIGVALGGGIWNLLPFVTYARLVRSRLAASRTAAQDLADPRWVGLIAAGVALFVTAGALQTMVLLDVLIAQPDSMSRYAIGYLAIILLVFAMMLVGYWIGWVSAALCLAVHRWRRRTGWRRRRDG